MQNHDLLLQDTSQVVLKRSPEHLSHFQVDVDKLVFYKYAQEKTEAQIKREKALEKQEKNKVVKLGVIHTEKQSNARQHRQLLSVDWKEKTAALKDKDR